MTTQRVIAVIERLLHCVFSCPKDLLICLLPELLMVEGLMRNYRKITVLVELGARNEVARRCAHFHCSPIAFIE